MILVLRVPASEDVDAAKEHVKKQLPKDMDIILIAIPENQDLYQIVKQGE